MKNFNKILWGIVLIAIGLLIGLNSLDILDINLFFKGWWTLFIIVPAFISLFSNEGKLGNIIWLFIGIMLLLVSRDIIDFQLFGKLLFPFIFIMIGLSLLYNEIFKSSVSTKIKQNKNLDNIVATFNEEKLKVTEEYKGSIIDSIFGNVVLDLKNAKIKKEAVIRITAVFAGTTVLVPSDVNVVTKSTGIFGGTSNKTSKSKDNDKTIYIESTCLFGGVEIK